MPKEADVPPQQGKPEKGAGEKNDEKKVEPFHLEPQQSAQQFQLEHRGPFRFTPRHIMCGDTTLDMGAVIYGS